MFNRLFYPIVLSGLLALTGCSSESIKRNTYQSLQSIERQECLKQPNKDCTDPAGSYNQFEKQREEELQK